MSKQQEQEQATSNTSILDLMLEEANKRFKSTGGTKSNSYISRTVALLTDDDGNPTPAKKFNFIVATIATEKTKVELGRDPDFENPEDTDVVHEKLDKTRAGVKQVFGTAKNSNSLKHNKAYKNKYKGIVNDDGTVALELIETEDDGTVALESNETEKPAK